MRRQLHFPALTVSWVAIALLLIPSGVQAQDISGVVAAGAEPTLVREGYTFLEGPVGTSDGGLFFSDLMGADKIYRLDPAGRITLVRGNTANTNGLALAKNGDLFGAEGDGKRINRQSATGQVTGVTAGITGTGLMSPNDLILDSKGGIYFTDPGPRPVVPGRKAYVYYLPPSASQPVMLDDSITRTNGLTLTNDGRTLIVDDTLGDTVFAFDVQPDGTVRNKRPFAKIRDVQRGEESGADGMAIDRDGRLFITSSTGVQVFDPKGNYLGTIKVPRQPANLAFSGPGKRTLYITARQGLYKLDTLTRGPDRPGK